MSELPDGLPNNCIGCDEDVPYVDLGATEWTEMPNNRIKLSLEKNGQKLMMIMSMEEILQPYYDELRKELDD